MVIFDQGSDFATCYVSHENSSALSFLNLFPKTYIATLGLNVEMLIMLDYVY